MTGTGITRIAITGCDGQLGKEISRQLGARAVEFTLADLDLTQAARVRRRLLDLRPAAVVNCAAYTFVDRAESEAETCFAVNAAAVETVASVCQELDCPLVQISTDYVFGGDAARRTPFREDDPTAATSVYGRSKLAGEEAARAWAKHCIVRTCGLYSLAPGGPQRGRNFVDTMLCLARTHSQLKVVNDQVCTPSYVPHVSTAVVRLLRRAADSHVPSAPTYGTYHVTNRGGTTWFEFAGELFRLAGVPMQLTPITTEEYGAAAPRPRYSVLDTSKFTALGLYDLPSWRDGLRAYFDSLPEAVAAGNHAA